MIEEILDKKTGVTFWTFGVEHYVLEEKTVPYEKNCESPKFHKKQDLPYGTFLLGHEKTFRNAINLQKVKRNINKTIEHLTKVKNILMISKVYLIDKISTILR